MPSESTTSASEFVEHAFETTVNDQSRKNILQVVDDTISNLRTQIDDETVERMLRNGAGSYVLAANMTRDGLQPESFTQEAVIEPLLEELDYEYNTEAGGLSGGRTEVSDYTVSLRDYNNIDSTRLLIEAEPINKDLNSRKHGAGQVKSWLSQREFESDFGFATDGLRWIFIRYDPDSYTHNIIEEVDLQPVFIALFENQVGERNPLEEAVFESDLEKVDTLIRTFQFANFRSIAGEARQVIKQKQEEITDEFYDDYIQYVFGVVSESEETPRSLTHDGVISPSGATADDTRLFSVEMMNRLIFIKFLEDKGIVRSDLLRSILDTYEDGLYTDSLYSEFFQPLFYDVLNERPNKRSEHIRNIDLFTDIPYLNGGLFRPSIEHDGSDNREAFEETDFDVRNSVLKSILELLGSYSFSTDGSLTDLDPSVLGNVFEKTINYITADNADQNKELGAYYTPKEITRFSAERTVRPALFDRLKQEVIEERGWPEAELDNYDTVYELIESLPASMDLITMLLDEVDNFRVVDPACGSGHFLTSVLEEIVGIRRALWAQTESYPHEQALKKTTVQHNIYGVDIVGPAVEIAKLRCWLSIISELEEDDIDEMDEEELALPNIAFNLRQGNSLIGYTGFPETTNDGDGYTLDSFNEDTVRTRYENIINEITAYEEAITSEQAEQHRKEANRLLQNAREELIDDVKDEFLAAGIEDITSQKIEEFDPFHWVLEYAEVYADGGFDVIVGNPPWEVLAPNRDEFFSRHDPLFRGRSPDEKEKKQEKLLSNDDISEEWQEYKQNFQRRADYFRNSGAYELQEPRIDGNIVPNNQNELSSLFLERVFSIARTDGYISQVLPGNIFNGSNSKDVRLHMINEAQLKKVVGFVNNGIFPEIATKYQFGLVVLKNSGETDAINGIFQQSNIDVLENFEKHSFDIPRSVLSQYSPEARIFPQLTSKEEVGVLESILKHTPLQNKEDWYVEPYRELDKYKDSDRYVEDKSEAEYPVLGGSNIYQFVSDWEFLDYLDSPELWSVAEDESPDKSAKRRIREKGKSRLKTQIYDEFGGTGSQKKFVNELLNEERGSGLKLEDVLLDCSDYRIVLRNIARSTDERTLIASVIPPDVVCHHAISTVKQFEVTAEKDDLARDTLKYAYEPIFTDEQLFYCLGILNSIPFDFLMRTKVDSNIVQYKLEESQVPRLDSTSKWFNSISEKAAQLNCIGSDFSEMRDRLGGIEPVTEMSKRREVQAEIDAAAFHAYGLDHDQTAFVLDDFHRVQSPRLMNEDYFELVLEKYEQLGNRSERQPQ